MNDIFDTLPTDRFPLPFLEALPSLTAREVHDELRRGRDQCDWLWSDSGWYMRCRIERLDGAHLRLAVTNQPSCLMNQGEAIIKVSKASNYSDLRAFSLFDCPACGSTRRKLLAYDTWRCRDCCKVPYRSERLSAKVRKWERMDELAKKIVQGRPKGMHHKTFASLVREHDRLKRELGDTRATPPREYQLMLSQQWSSSRVRPF